MIHHEIILKDHKNEKFPESNINVAFLMSQRILAKYQSEPT